MTDVERLAELRDLVDGKRPSLSFIEIDGLRLVLGELDAANRTIDELREDIKRHSEYTAVIAKTAQSRRMAVYKVTPAQLEARKRYLRYLLTGK